MYRDDVDGDEKRIVRPSRRGAQARGEAAEVLAAEFLSRHGLIVLARNIRCRRGEIDLICLDGAMLVFVEVRLRSNARFGGAAASITARKQQRVIHAARWWLAGSGHRHAERACRFDAVLFDGLDGSRVSWLKAAFAGA